MALPTCPLGTEGLIVSVQGLGCMSMSSVYGPGDDDESVATLKLALDRGVTLLGHGRRLRLRPQRGARRPGHRRPPPRGDAGHQVRDRQPARAAASVPVDGRPAYVAKACDASLQRLGVDHIDLYYLHRPDPEVPIEDTVAAMAELVAAGKVRYLGLSEASAGTIRRAAAVHPITALQSEWCRSALSGGACSPAGCP